MRVGILTSDDIRHRYFVNAVAERFDVVAVGYEKTGYRPVDAAAGADIDDRAARLVRHHFQERRRQEEAFFGQAAGMREDGTRCGVCTLDRTSLNGPQTVSFLQGRCPDVVLVYGTDLIRPPLLDRFAGRMINLHLGLSPYYRGTATNFYPLVNDEPEYVGATIHLIDTGIDTGSIIHQTRPDIMADDMPHTVGCKAILAGISKVIQSLEELQAGTISPVPQWHVETARLYLRKDYHPSHVVKLYERIEDGLFANYAARQGEVANTFRLVP